MPDYDYLKPNVFCPAVEKIDFKSLREHGISNICLDLDNTLCLPSESQPWNEKVEHLLVARQAGYIDKICLVSNIAFGQKRLKRVQQAADILDTPYYVAATLFHQKPGAWPFQEAMNLMMSLPQNTAMIGDQLFTDIEGAKKLHMFTVLVNPLGPDHWFTRLLGRRQREDKVLKALGISRYPKAF